MRRPVYRGHSAGGVLRPAIREWFRAAGFAEVAFRYPSPGHGVGVHRLVAPPRPFVPGKRLFAFTARSGYPPPVPTPQGAPSL